MPMLLLSGAFFPMQGAHPIMAFLMAIDPLTYGVGALRHVLQGPIDGGGGVPEFWLCLLVTVAFAVGTFALGTWVVTRRSARDAA
jgi:ABC-2 type transport system permease protein